MLCDPDTPEGRDDSAVMWPSSRRGRPSRRLVKPSGTSRGDAQPVAVGVREVALAPGEPVLIDGNPELLGERIDVPDVEVDQGVRPSVAGVLRQIQPDVSTCDGDEPGKAGFELMLPLLDEPEPPVPRDSPRRVLDTEYRHDLLVHRPTLTRRRQTASRVGRLSLPRGSATADRERSVPCKAEARRPRTTPGPTDPRCRP